MKELVGMCSNCNKEIYCLDGFINGVVINNSGKLLCFDCEGKIDTI